MNGRKLLGPVWAAALAVAVVVLPGPANRAQAADDGSGPTQPVKRVFLHHSVGENWLSDDQGGLGRALAANNYFVSDTNYGWGPNSIGDRTDIPDWLEWFRGGNSGLYLGAVFAENGRNSQYARPLANPGGPNQVVMFKSCYPNASLAGGPNDPPAAGGGGQWRIKPDSDPRRGDYRALRQRRLSRRARRNCQHLRLWRVRCCHRHQRPHPRRVR